MAIITTLILGTIAGLIGAAAMNLFLRSVGAKLGSRGNMIQAIGSFYTRSTKNATTVGNLIHGIAGAFFGATYALSFLSINGLQFPHAFFLGIGFGLIHGMLMSYVLMFYASKKHPLEEYRKATIEEGALHLIGHILFGAVTGLVISLLLLII